MDWDLLFWVLARVAGMTAFVALSISLLSGLALRTAVLDRLVSNRALVAAHEFTTLLWAPFGLLHLGALLLDRTARVGPLDLLVPFAVPYGTLAIGLGTVSAEIFALVALAAWLRRRLNAQLWQWLHRLAYLAFALAFLHALLAGSDFSDPLISAVTWAIAGALATLSIARLLWGRLPA
jgi:methionine sulfoxide reductase heme-binding subunit